MKVEVTIVAAIDLESVIQIEKDKGKMIVALAPAKIVRGNVTSYTLVTR